MKRLLSAFLCLVMVVSMATLGTAQAAKAPDNERGLSIAPLRQFPKLNAGTSQNAKFTVSNLTARDLTVRVSVKQFSVADYSYNYDFGDPTNDWLKLDQTQIVLPPGHSQDVPYTITIPAGTAPGGHYYTLFASTTLSTGGLPSTVQAAVLVYLTVNGKLTKTTELRGSSIQHLSFGKQINYSLDPVDTGNIYSFIYVSGQVHGLFIKNDQEPVTHLLLPGAVRAVSGSIPAPKLPGIYHATYGYKTDAGSTVSRSGWVVFIPPWFIAFLLALLLISNRFLVRRKKKRVDM